MQQRSTAAILGHVLIVARYLLREFLLASGAVLLGIVVTLIAADTLLHLDDLDGGLSAWLDGLDRMLDVIPLGVPMACTVGVVWSLTRAVRSREITAIRCGGIPLRTALLPIVAASAVISLLLGVFQDRVSVQLRQERFDAQQDAERARPVKRNGHWWYASGASVFVATGYDAKTGSLEDVTWFEYSEQRTIRLRIDAASAVHVDGNHWEFRDAVVRSFGGERLGLRVEPTVRVDLGLSTQDLEHAGRPARYETLHGLASRMRDEAGEQLTSLEASFHGRLAQPLSVLVLVLLALPFAVRDAERGDSFPRALLAALVAAGGFFALWSGALLAARMGILPPALPVWAVMLGVLAAASWRFRQVSE